MTQTLKAAFKEAAELPESEQDELASAVLAKVRELNDRPSVEFTRLSQERFSLDWDNEKDTEYDNWKELYGVS